jgi:hypothetical protein
MASKAITVVKEAASEPVLTGALLYLLTRGPAHVRARLLAPFQGNVLAKNGVKRLATFITVLKVLTSLNVLRRISQGLDSLAWNNWALGRSGAAFKFGPAKEELVIITGGSSGFGYEMVKAFSKVARVVVLDVQSFPPELASCKLHSISVQLVYLREYLVSGVHFYKCDVTDTPAVEALCKEIRDTHGEATVLVNNAGIGIGKTVLEVRTLHPCPGRSLKLTNNLLSRQPTRSARNCSRSTSSHTSFSSANSYLGCLIRKRVISLPLPRWLPSSLHQAYLTTAAPRSERCLYLKVGLPYALLFDVS